MIRTSLRSRTVLFLLSSVLVAAAAGCGSPPEDEALAVEEALAAAEEAEAETYASDQLAVARRNLEAARTEIEAENQKYFSDFDEARRLLEEAERAAVEARAAAGENKDQTRRDAGDAVHEASAAIEAARRSLRVAPAGKGSRADLAFYRSDLDELDARLTEAEDLLAEGDFAAALDRALAIRERADEINADLTEVIERSGRGSRI